jgi:hypothetical protein
MALRVEQERPGIGPKHDGGGRRPTIAAVAMLDPFTAAKRETRRFAEMVAGPLPGPAVAGPRSLAHAQLAVVRTTVTYLHLLAEQRSDPTPLVTGVGALAELILGRATIAPHLAPVLESALFTALAPHPF